MTYRILVREPGVVGVYAFVGDSLEDLAAQLDDHGYARSGSAHQL